MHETPEDLRELQALLDRSYAGAGEHLLSIHTPERRLSAEGLVERLTGVCVLDLATVTASCEPRVSPVDGLFFRGAWWFGSSPTSFRFRHIRRRPQVSGAHTVGEELAVIVHGRAVEIDPVDEPGFRAYLGEVYPDWEEWGSDAPYARIEADAMFAMAFS